MSGEEAVLAELTSLLRKEVRATRLAVRLNLNQTGAILNDLRGRRKTDSVDQA